MIHEVERRALLTPRQNGALARAPVDSATKRRSGAGTVFDHLVRRDHRGVRATNAPHGRPSRRD